MSMSIWFWQRIVTPHMAGLAQALARRGHEVAYIAEVEMSGDRAAMGWETPQLEGVALYVARTPERVVELVRKAPQGTRHVTPGFRAHGVMAYAQAEIRIKKDPHYVIMETVDPRGMLGWLRTLLYAWHVQNWHSRLNGILAIGADTTDWLARLAPRSLAIHPFAYFLSNQATRVVRMEGEVPFRFLFVGALIPRKRVEMLIQALASHTSCSFQLEIVGDGPIAGQIQDLADLLLPGRVTFAGTLPMSEVPDRMAHADCLVLPSAHDGWGAVISEALMVGTSVICSAACGASVIVRASEQGGVFATHDAEALSRLLRAAMDKGRISPADRVATQRWAHCLSADAGAEYVEALFTARALGQPPPRPPWEQLGEREA